MQIHNQTQTQAESRRRIQITHTPHTHTLAHTLRAGPAFIFCCCLDCWLACLPAIQSTVNMLESDSYTLTSFNFCRQPRSKWFRVCLTVSSMYPVPLLISFPASLPIQHYQQHSSVFCSVLLSAVVFLFNWKILPTFLRKIPKAIVYKRVSEQPSQQREPVELPFMANPKCTLAEHTI